MTNYKCPACTGPLHFDSTTGKLVCDYCDSSFEIAEIEALFAEKDAKAEEAFRPEAAPEKPAEEIEPEELSQEEKDAWIDSQWDTSSISDSWGDVKMRAYNCPSCGAELICEETTAATQCPYCGNPTIVPGQFKDTLKPDYILPFALDKDAAVAALKKHYKGKLFLPRAFTDANQIKKLQGVYVPFWLFDADAEGDCRYDCSNTHTHREGDYRVTETDHFDVYRKGSVSFRLVPADASKKMPDDLMDSIEPYNYQDMKPFSTAFLPGYLADKYDVSIKECSSRADRRCTASVKAMLQADVHGYMSTNPAREDVHLHRGKVHYALLPVWMLKTTWQGKDYLFAMNGQTGKLVGNLPMDSNRFWGFFAAVTALLALLLYGTGISNLLAGIIVALLS